ncbi:hypothetical protein SAMN00120144_4126 [Hymenobacter roseosalivarius DSM 11622]|uniref:Uncharacterized protein n=1 Tax=Hymenobacter roseosalivarius DSM 11622 TaxID=645990 RepID=A0A1W1W4Y8_9BACT|nr:hypothetical protein [Hymenobacter roseosalivarius]SMC00583.1 hypothetical protein SAMN00120144_4126 [Hymenobacter roseosalivarius DSM 11622]
MAKSQNSSKGVPTPDESNPDASGSTDSTSDEPVNLSMLEGGVLHNPPQATQSQESGPTDDE